MSTNQTRVEELARRPPEDLWLDDGVSPEELIRFDPCREIEDLLKLAGFITEVDAFVAGLSEKGLTKRQEELWLKVHRFEAGQQEPPEEFIKRLRG